MSVFNHISRFNKKSSTEDSFLENVTNRYHSEFDADMVTKKVSDTDGIAFTQLTNKLKAIASEEDMSKPVVSTFDAYKTFKGLADESSTPGLKSIAFYVKTQWENDPTGYLSIDDIESTKKYAEKIMPKRMFTKSSQAVTNAFNSMLKASIKNRFDISSLDKIASSIDSPEDFTTAMELHGLSLDRADHEEIRNYIAYRAGIENVDVFSSESKAKDTLNQLSGNSGEFDVDKLKGILSEDWAVTQASLEKETALKSIFKHEGSALGKLTLKEALDQSDIAHNANPKDGKTYIARKDIFGEYSLYIEKAGEDAKLLSKFASVEELIEDAAELPHSWEV